MVASGRESRPRRRRALSGRIVEKRSRRFLPDYPYARAGGPDDVVVRLVGNSRQRRSATHTATECHDPSGGGLSDASSASACFGGTGCCSDRASTPSRAVARVDVVGNLDCRPRRGILCAIGQRGSDAERSRPPVDEKLSPSVRCSHGHPIAVGWNRCPHVIGSVAGARGRSFAVRVAGGWVLFSRPFAPRAIESYRCLLRIRPKRRCLKRTVARAGLPPAFLRFAFRRTFFRFHSDMVASDSSHANRMPTEWSRESLRPPDTNSRAAPSADCIRRSHRASGADLGTDDVAGWATWGFAGVRGESVFVEVSAGVAAVVAAVYVVRVGHVGHDAHSVLSTDQARPDRRGFGTDVFFFTPSPRSTVARPGKPPSRMR